MSEPAWIEEPLRGGDDTPFADVVDALCAANERGPGSTVPALLPSRHAVIEIVENLRAVLYQHHPSTDHCSVCERHAGNVSHGSGI